MECRELHCAKIPFPIDITESGMVIPRKDVQHWKAPAPIDVVLARIGIALNLLSAISTSIHISLVLVSKDTKRHKTSQGTSCKKNGKAQLGELAKTEGIIIWRPFDKLRERSLATVLRQAQQAMLSNQPSIRRIIH